MTVPAGVATPVPVAPAPGVPISAPPPAPGSHTQAIRDASSAREALKVRVEAVAAQEAAAAVATPPAPTPAEQPATPATEQPAKAESEAQSSDDSDEDDEAPLDDPSDDDTDEDEGLSARLEANGFRARLDALPAEARALFDEVQAKLTSSYTRARQQDRAELAELNTLRAETEYRKANEPLDVAYRYAKDPQFKAAIDAHLQQFADFPAAVDYAKRDIDTGRQAATNAIQAQLDQQHAQTEYSNKVYDDAMAALKTLNIPLNNGKMPKLLVTALRDAMIEKGEGKLTRPQTERVVKDYHAEVRGVQRAEKRTASAATLAKRVADAQKPGVTKPGSGLAPAPAAAPTPKNNAEWRSTLKSRVEAAQAG